MQLHNVLQPSRQAMSSLIHRPPPPLPNHCCNSDGQFPLHEAIAGAHLPVVLALVLAKSDVNSKNKCVLLFLYLHLRYHIIALVKHYYWDEHQELFNPVPQNFKR